MVFGLTKKLFIILFFLFYALFSGFGEDKGKTTAQGNGEKSKKPTLVMLPLISKDVPGYIPKVVDKLLEAKLEKINTYTILPKEDVDRFLVEQGIVLKTEPQLDYLKKYSDLLNVDQIMYGIIRSENKEYKLVTRIYDVKKQEIILKDTETAKDIRHLDTAADNLTRKIIKRLFPPAVVKKAEQVLNKAADTKKEAQVKQNLADFAALAEKNPGKALSLVAEPARKAIENKVKKDVKAQVKKEVVHEEIQNLFEKEKEEKALSLKRKWQFWTTFSLKTFNQFGNLFGSLAEYERFDSLLYWNKYMNNVFQDNPYTTYRNTVKGYEGFSINNYIFSGGSNLAIAVGMNYMLKDTFTFSKSGKFLFALSYGFNTLGDAFAVLTTQLSFLSLRKYLEYENTTSGFTAKYTAYRDSLIWPAIARYTSYGLWGLGYTGMVVSYLLPGERSPVIRSKKARQLLSWGSALAGFGDIASGIALNYRGKAEESWVTDTSPGGVTGDSLTKNYTLTADILTYTAYGLLLGGSALSVIGLFSPEDGKPAVSEAEKKVSFNVIPSTEGTSLVVNLRLE